MASIPYTGSFICCLPPPDKSAEELGITGTREEQHLAAKIRRAMASGPLSVTKDATVAELQADGTIKTLREGTNSWTCFPGNENEVGNVPMTCDPQGLIWFKDVVAKKPAPTNTAPGLIYMLCGASQHSTTDPHDASSPAVPIGPHWMITWPFNAKRDGLPNTVRDAGTWVMFDGTPYAHLHICGSPWDGNLYDRGSTTAKWTMEYAPRS